MQDYREGSWKRTDRVLSPIIVCLLNIILAYCFNTLRPCD